MNNESTLSTNSGVPQNKAELMERIRRERAALEQVISSLSDDQMTTPGPERWSVKDHLAHIVTWEQILLLTHMQGRPFAEAAKMDEATAAATADMTAEGGINDFFYERDKDRPLGDVLHDFQQSHQEVLAALETMEYAELVKLHHPDNPDAGRLLDYVIGDTYEHYAEHRNIIATFKEQEG